MFFSSTSFVVQCASNIIQVYVLHQEVFLKEKKRRCWMIDWRLLCAGVAALSWPSTSMRFGTRQDVTGCVILAAEQLQVRSSLCRLFYFPANPVESFLNFLFEPLPFFTRKMWRHKTSRRRPGRWCRSWRWPPPTRRSSRLWSCWTPGWAKVQPRGGRWSRPPDCRGCRLSKSLCTCCCTTTSGRKLVLHLYSLYSILFN